MTALSYIFNLIISHFNLPSSFEYLKVCSQASSSFLRSNPSGLTKSSPLFIWKRLYIVMWNFHLIYENCMNFFFAFFPWMIEESLKKARKMKSNVMKVLENISVKNLKKSSHCLFCYGNSQFQTSYICRYEILIPATIRRSVTISRRLTNNDFSLHAIDLNLFYWFLF